MIGRPRISVIVPTHGRPSSLLRTLRALEDQLEPVAMEVIVVLDGPSEESERALRSLGTTFPLHVLVQEQAGAASARNRGADRALAPLLLFLDDDVEPLPGLLPAHLRAHESTPGAVVLGPYWPEIPVTRRLHPIMVREWWAATFNEMSKPGHRFGYRDLLAGNLSIPADLFRARRGFDPDFPMAGGEDWELGIRLLRSGAAFVYTPDAAARHHETSTPAKSFRRARLEGAGDVRIGLRHPWLRGDLPYAWWRKAGRLKRFVQWVAFRAPAVGDLAVAVAPWPLHALDVLRCRAMWHRLGHIVRHYSYWRGIAELLPGVDDLDAFLDPGARTDPAWREIEIDLRAGLHEARRRLDRERPDAVRLRYGSMDLGAMPPIPGLEPLAGRHLDALLETLGVPLFALSLIMKRSSDTPTLPFWLRQKTAIQ
jgi:GT2 family glycosyltransferase